VTDVGQASDGAPYLVMEFLEGQDGAKLLRQQGALPVRRAADIVLQVCRGLAVAHRAGIVHRDLKPENIFLTDAGDGRDQVKVLDFGIAKLRATDASVATGTGAAFGTAFYMSPEQARGAGEVDHRSDVWSLGVVLYELLAGRKPFEAGAFLEVIYKILSTDPQPLDEARPGLPPKLVALVHRALRREPLERLPSVVAMADELASFASAPLVSAAGPLTATALAEPTRATAGAVPRRGPAVTPAIALLPRRRRRVAAFAAVVGLVGGISALALRAASRWPSRPRRRRRRPGPRRLRLPWVGDPPSARSSRSTSSSRTETGRHPRA